MSDKPAALELLGIEKRFGAVRANKAVDLRVEAGTIHGIIGENGAGKSTLMSIVFGFYEADAGEIRVHGRPSRIRSPSDAIRAGIGMVHQHFMLVGPLTVIENVMLGVEGGPLLAAGEKAARAELARLSAEYGLEVDPDAVVEDLPVGLRQRVEILKALIRRCDILILDEPTAVLTPGEAGGLFRLLRRLAEQGVTVLLITHKLKEIMDVTSRVSVMRRGEMIATLDTAATSPAALAEAMVGRRVATQVEKAASAGGAVMIEVRDLVVRDAVGVARVDGVSFDVRAGEIVGVAGVSGNGQSELLEALAGMRGVDGGEIRLAGETLHGVDPRDLRARGLLHIPEDRLHAGLVGAFPAHESAILGFQHEERYGPGPLLSPGAEIRDLEPRLEAYDVRPRDPRLKTSKFSGGNQQKIVLAREIDRAPKVLLVGQPTRGVDIGAIEFIHKRLVALRDAGVAVLLVSVEIDEVMALSDRIIVMCGGRITGERLASRTDEQDLGLLMAGVTERAA